MRAFLWMLTWVLTLTTSYPVFAAAVGQVIMLEGTATAELAGKVRALYSKSEIYPQDKIDTQAESKLQIRFADGTMFELFDTSRLKVMDFRYVPQDTVHVVAEFQLIQGGCRVAPGKIVTTRPERFKLFTSAATVAPNSALFGVMLHQVMSPPRLALSVSVWSGDVTLSNRSGYFMLGQSREYQHATVFDQNTQPKMQLQIDPGFHEHFLNSTFREGERYACYEREARKAMRYQLDHVYMEFPRIAPSHMSWVTLQRDPKAFVADSIAEVQ